MPVLLDAKDNRLFQVYDKERLNELGEHYKTIGLEIIKRNEVCLIILAGGQGTRLGYDGPKGLFQLPHIGILFDHFREKANTIGEEAGVVIRIFVMTSDHTEEETRRHFIKTKDDYKNIETSTFLQDSVACEAFTGEHFIVRGKIVKSPNGNGGIFKAIEKLDLTPFKYVNVIGVDNVLCNLIDPVALGCSSVNSLDILSKSVTRWQEENVGVFVLNNNNQVVINEYSESNFGCEEAQANILNHIFTTEFLTRVDPNKLDFHIAKKKIMCEVDGVIAMPEKPNGYKKELFIFDAFKFTDKCAVLNVIRDQEFSPLKNKHGERTDSPETCVRDFMHFKAFKKLSES